MRRNFKSKNFILKPIINNQKSLHEPKTFVAKKFLENALAMLQLFRKQKLS